MALPRIVTDKRIIAVVGHYGSGKTEFSVSLAFRMAEAGYRDLAVVDLDIANPYFRSRERKEALAAAGVAVYGSAYDTEITAELPALAAWIRKPLESPDTRVIVDVGGDDSGARIINQFKKYFQKGEHELLCVINRCRPETRGVTGAISHIRAIEAETGLQITGFVSNSHLLRETTLEVVAGGWEFCSQVSAQTGIPIRAVCCPAGLTPQVEEYRTEKGADFEIMPLGLYMRETWLDKKL